MSSRDEILKSLRSAETPATKLPDLGELETVRYDDLVGQFEKALEQVGGKLVRVADRSGISRSLETLEVFRDAKTIFSELESEASGNVDLASLDSPRELDGLDIAIIEGEFAVAENGAIWVNGSRFAERAVLFLTEHLVLIVTKDDLVHNMSNAYSRLSLPTGEFGLFISGPSKTADIEQSLVIGAQGPRSLHVLMVG